jgi:hypothetical protein
MHINPGLYLKFAFERHPLLLSVRSHVLVVLVSMCFRGKPRRYFSLAGFLHRPLWTFQLWPLESRAPTDASRTPAAEGGTYGRGIRPVI